MLSYWILRDQKGAPLGLVRVEDDRVVLRLKTPIEGTFTLFSETGAVPIVPETETHLSGALALLGTEHGRVTAFAAAKNAEPLACYREKISHIYTKAEEMPPAPPIPDPPEALEPLKPDKQVQKNTIEPEEMPEEPEKAEDVSRNSTIEEQLSVTETARETEAFSLLLRRSDAFYERYAKKELSNVDNLVQKEDKSDEESGMDLFPQAFPGARWRYVDGTDVLGHYEGVYRQQNGTNLHILAVRGRAAPCPPRMLVGFTRFLRADDGTGYWIKVTPLP